MIQPMCVCRQILIHVNLATLLKWNNYIRLLVEAGHSFVQTIYSAVVKEPVNLVNAVCKGHVKSAFGEINIQSHIISQRGARE